MPSYIGNNSKGLQEGRESRKGENRRLILAHAEIINKLNTVLGLEMKG